MTSTTIHKVTSITKRVDEFSDFISTTLHIKTKDGFTEIHLHSAEPIEIEDRPSMEPENPDQIQLPLETNQPT